jgi:hypothetical protein
MFYSLRSLMIVVTLTAMILGWWNHRRFCLENADKHAAKSTHLMLQAMIFSMRSGIPPTEEEKRKEDADVSSYLRLSDLHGCCATEYRRAVWRPWIRWTLELPSKEVP